MQQPTPSLCACAIRWPHSVLLFIQENETLYYFSNVVLYIVFGLAQLALTYAMARRFRNAFPETSTLSQGLGIVWATLVLAAGMIGNVGTKAALYLLVDDNNEPERAAALWDAVNTIHTSIGGGNEIAGGFKRPTIDCQKYFRKQERASKNR